MQLDKPTPIRTGEELSIPILEKYFKEKIPNFDKIIEVNQYPGGYSNLTYQIISDKKEYVLRRAPLGANIKNAHDMGREFKVLAELQKYYSLIPKVEILCEDTTLIGAPFYLMEKIDGVILRAKDASKYDFKVEKWNELSNLMIENLANLHLISIENTALEALGRPEGYVDRQVDGWIGRYTKSQTDEIEVMDSIAHWLAGNRPRPQKPTFLHNDYKYDNIIFDENLSKIKAVLDWEMATVGDPLMDLGATLAYWCEPSDGDFLKSMNITWLNGNITRKQIVEQYSQITKIDTSDILFYYVFGLYKNATIVQQIYARWKGGFTKDARFASLIVGVKELANMAQNAINKNSI
jgi:aminoglycoside phosphotransferase (APT) family kinase protein